MNRGNLDEALVDLYLRLNGYFTTGLVVHSPIHGAARSDIDCLAVRLPHHSQQDRMVEAAPFVEARSDVVDLLICEVKSDPAMLRFNPPLRNDVEVMANALRWSGALAEENIAEVASAMQSLVREGTPSSAARVGVERAGVRVRALLCCPILISDAEDRWSLTGTEILRYAAECFNPEQQRPTCSARYNFQQWTSSLYPIVQWLKNRKLNTDPTVQELYTHMGV